MKGNLVRPDKPPKGASEVQLLKYYLGTGFYLFKKATEVTTADIAEPLEISVSTFGQWRSNSKKAFPLTHHWRRLHLFQKSFGKGSIFPYRKLDIWYMITGEVGTDTERELFDELNKQKALNRELEEKIQDLENELLAYRRKPT